MKKKKFKTLAKSFNIKNTEIMEDKFKSTCWPLQLNNVESWSYWHPAFSPEECEKIIEIGNKKGLIKGEIYSGYSKEVRDSNISWIYPSDDFHWVFQRMTDIVMDLNNKYFKFDIYGFMEGLQFTHYKAPGGKYKKHVDVGLNSYVRKLSVSIQLSDPDSYEGGDFNLHVGHDPISFPKEQGKLILFPSYSLHEVTPVTKGERYSLVAWITGPQFK